MRQRNLRHFDHRCYLHKLVVAFPTKNNVFGRSSSMPPMPPSLKSANFIFIVVSPSLKQGRGRLGFSQCLLNLHAYMYRDGGNGALAIGFWSKPTLGGTEITRILSDNNSPILTAPWSDPLEGGSRVIVPNNCHCISWEKATTINATISKMLLFLCFRPTIKFQGGSPVDPLPCRPPFDSTSQKLFLSSFRRL